MRYFKIITFSFFVILLLNLKIFAQAPLYFINNYTMAGYNMVKVPNKKLFVLCGNLYKDPVNTGCTSMDSLDMHFLVVDEEGKVVLSKVFDSELNDIVYDITLAEFIPGTTDFLLTGTLIGDGVNCPNSPNFSTSGTFLLRVDLNGNILQNVAIPYLGGNGFPVNYSALNCPSMDEIGMREGRGFKSVFTGQGIYTVGFNTDHFSNPSYFPFVAKPKIATLKKFDNNFIPLWDRLITNGLTNTPCFSPSFPYNDFDILTNIIEVPGVGIFVCGTTSIEKNLGISNMAQTTLAILFDYNGNVIYNWSHFTSFFDNSPLVPVDCIYSNDGLVYLLENDLNDWCINILGLNPITGNIDVNIRNKTNIYNPDIKVRAFELQENVNKPEELYITGMAEMLNPPMPSQVPTAFVWTPFYTIIPKDANPSSIIFYHQSSAIDNSEYIYRGDELSTMPDMFPKYFTPTHSSLHDISSSYQDEVLTVGYDKNNITNNYGIKLVTSKIYNSTDYDNSCDNRLYDSGFLTPSTNFLPVSVVTSPPQNYFNIDFLMLDHDLFYVPCSEFDGGYAQKSLLVQQSIKIEPSGVFYPNPNKGLLHFTDVNDPNKEYYFSVIDYTGKKIIDNMKINNNNFVDISKFELKGEYFILLFLNGKINSTSKVYFD